MLTFRRRLLALLSVAVVTLAGAGCEAPPDEADEGVPEEGTQPLAAGETVPGLVMGLRHNLNQTTQSTVMPSAPASMAVAMDGGDRGAANHRGYQWWMVRDQPLVNPATVALPPGVVVALKHNVNQARRAITAFGRDPVTGPASFPGFVKMAGGDRGASAGQGYVWYESTGAGFTDWASTANLPNMTVVGLRHSQNNAGRPLVWQGRTFDSTNPIGPVPDGFMRQCGGDWGAPSGSGFCWFERRGATTGAFLSAPRISLGRSIFVTPGSPGDRDIDGLDDGLENALAEATSPFIRFDSNERHRLEDEPVTLYRVFADPPQSRTVLKIRWVFLFWNDGGYGESSGGIGGCKGKDWHPGDNDTATWDFTTADGGATWTMSRARLGRNKNDAQITWPGGSRLEVRDLTHPVIYMSEGKHHEYFTRDSDGADSFYSFPQDPWFGQPLGHCNDDIDGLGLQLFPNLHLFDGGNNVGEPNIEGEPNNSGEPTRHLIDDLFRFFPGETAWGTNPFRGRASPNESQWLKP